MILQAKECRNLVRIKRSLIAKITILIAIEIVIIAASLGILAYFQSESTLIGNSINIAGKNRFLTVNAILEAEKYLDGRSNVTQVNRLLDDLNSNIVILKTGGNVAGLDLGPLPPEYISGWMSVNQKWNEFRLLITQAINPNYAGSKIHSIQEIEQKGNSLIAQSDMLVSQISNGSSQNSRNLIMVQLLLLLLNIAVHVIMLYIIIRMVKPIIALTGAARQVKNGDLNVSLDTSSPHQEISELTLSFSEMVNGLRNRDMKQQEFINNVADELRNPIQPIIGLAEVLHEKDQDKENNEIIDAILRNAHRLQLLIEEILDVAKIEAGSFQLRKETFDLSDAVGDIVRDLGITRRSRVVIRNDIPPHTLIHADKLRIERVISTLLNNALRFTDKGTITVATQNADQQVTLSISDSDVGMSHVITRLFQKYSGPHGAGTDISLYMSKNIIERHGGKLWEANTSAGGATFGFTIPAGISKS